MNIRNERKKWAANTAKVGLERKAAEFRGERNDENNVVLYWN